MLKNNKGVSMISIVITIIVIIILSAVALSNSSDMIDDSITAVTEADKMEDNDTIRTLLTYAVTDRSARTGIALSDSTNVVIGSGDVNYGTGYYLIVGGSGDSIKKIEEKTGATGLKAYKDLTAPYVVNYDMGTYERIEEIRFR
ncbi:MAG: hypothetical protein IKJ32_00355 [Clostridia bacterium]|nr:hypothetical protein [Clostridia bacterium]